MCSSLISLSFSASISQFPAPELLLLLCPQQTDQSLRLSLLPVSSLHAVTCPSGFVYKKRPVIMTGRPLNHLLFFVQRFHCIFMESFSSSEAFCPEYSGIQHINHNKNGKLRRNIFSSFQIFLDCKQHDLITEIFKLLFFTGCHKYYGCTAFFCCFKRIYNSLCFSADTDSYNAALPIQQN